MLIINEDEITPELMEYVNSLIEQGFTSGYYPHWEIK
jgi:hypothetical protein